jgi:hypothetical protein
MSNLPHFHMFRDDVLLPSNLRIVSNLPWTLRVPLHISRVLFIMALRTSEDVGPIFTCLEFPFYFYFYFY